MLDSMGLDDVKKHLVAGHACVRVVTLEEGDVLSEVVGQVMEMGLTPWLWSSVHGVRRTGGTSGEVIAKTENPAAALTWAMQRWREPMALITLDLADRLDDTLVLRALRELIETFRVQARALSSQRVPGEEKQFGPRIIMIDHKDEVPAAIGAVSVRCAPELPDDEALMGVLKSTARRMHTSGHLRQAGLSAGGQRRAVEIMRGLTARQAEQLLVEACMDGSLEENDLSKLFSGKRRLLEDSGVLEFVDAPTSMDDIGGLSGLKAWLRKRESGFDPKMRESAGLMPPRGLLLLGVQGAGKSLASKAIATGWKRPLMKLDPSALFDRYIGESERRLRDALRQAEAMSPVVLWIDEIEKGFASAASTSVDGGLSRRMFGTLLTWMQEHRAPVFTVATANDIAALPPELLRKGRFDEIFFVDLPGEDARRAILEIHLRKRRQDVKTFDMPALITASAGFSGAEIEQAIMSALYEAASSQGGAGEGVQIDTRLVIEELSKTKPLSVTMRESVQNLRAWAAERCVMAD